MSRIRDLGGALSAITAIRRSSDGPDRHARQDNQLSSWTWRETGPARPIYLPAHQRPCSPDPPFSNGQSSLLSPPHQLASSDGPSHRNIRGELEDALLASASTFPWITIDSRPVGHTAAIYLARTDLEPILFEGFATNGFAACGQLTTTTNRTHSTTR